MQHEESGIVESDPGVADDNYFKAAREWYGVVYHYPIADRALYIIICLLAIATMLMSGFVLYSFYPLERDRPLVVYSDDVFGEVPRVTKIAEPGEDFNFAIASHIVPIYLKTREYYEYDVKKLEEGFSLIRRQSSKKVFEEYQSFMSPQNRASPLTRYGKGIKREVRILSSSVNISEPPYTARIKFQSSVNDGRQIHKNKYIADITFRFSKIQVDQGTGDVFKEDISTGEIVAVGGAVDFVVTKYSVKEQMATN